MATCAALQLFYSACRTLFMIVMCTRRARAGVDKQKSREVRHAKRDAFYSLLDQGAQTRVLCRRQQPSRLNLSWPSQHLEARKHEVWLFEQ
jgi:hypothetical protein